MAYTCPRCGLTSQHPRDAEEQYCGQCRMFEDEDGPSPGVLADRRRAARDKLISNVTELLQMCADDEALGFDVLHQIGRGAGHLQGAASTLDRLLAGSVVPP